MKKYWLFFSLSLLIYCVHFYFVGHGIYGDGNGYYSYTHALYFEHDLNFTPVYSYLSNFQGKKFLFSRLFWNTDSYSGGIRNCPWFIGTGLFWLPSMFFINLISLLGNLNLDKFSVYYELGPGITGILLGIWGLYFLEKYLNEFFDEATSSWTVSAVYLTTLVFYYFSFEPALSHQPSFFLISLLLLLTAKLKQPVKSRLIFLIGCLSGWLVITRPADSIFLIPVYRQLYNHKNLSTKSWLLNLTGLFIAISPQLIVQKMMYGTFWHNAYLNGEKGIFSTPGINSPVNNLFSPDRGLFLWSPLLFVGSIGLFISLRDRKLKSQATIMIITLGIALVIVSSWLTTVTAGFSNRLLFGSVPCLSFGIAYLVKNYSIKWRTILVSVFIIWNCLLIGQFYFDSNRMLKANNQSFWSFLSGQYLVPKKVIESVMEKGLINTINRTIMD